MDLETVRADICFAVVNPGSEDTLVMALKALYRLVQLSSKVLLISGSCLINDLQMLRRVGPKHSTRYRSHLSDRGQVLCPE